MKNTVLLCTFTNLSQYKEVIIHLQIIYGDRLGPIYVLQNTNDENQIILTYNVPEHRSLPHQVSEFTISVHRKKKTNTIYSINAINKLIHDKIGKHDPTYPIDWDELSNMVIVTAYGKLKKIHTNVYDIIKS